jgi:hypothetical protein
MRASLSLAQCAPTASPHVECLPSAGRVKRPTNLISIDALRELLTLDRETGRVYFKARPHASKESRFPRHKAGSLADTGTYPTRGYRRIRICIGGVPHDLLAHRVVFALAHGRWPEHEIDHINRDRTDNRPENLRDVSHAVNMANSTARLNLRRASRVSPVRLDAGVSSAPASAEALSSVKGC